MSFKKLKYNSGEGMAKIKILDDTGMQIENWTIMMSDLGRWASLMRQKYNITDKENKKDKDLDWAM